jgi:hypothetical protein
VKILQVSSVQTLDTEHVSAWWQGSPPAQLLYVEHVSETSQESFVLQVFNEQTLLCEHKSEKHVLVTVHVFVAHPSWVQEFVVHVSLVEQVSAPQTSSPHQSLVRLH